MIIKSIRVITPSFNQLKSLIIQFFFSGLFIRIMSVTSYQSDLAEIETELT